MLLMTQNEGELESLVRKRIRALRVAQGWSLEDLATRARVSQSTLSRIENGQRRLALDQLVTLARALDTSVDQLVATATEDVVTNPVIDSAHGQKRWSVKADPGVIVVRQRLTNPPPDNPARMRAHPGREWLVVLSGTAVLMLGNRRFRVETDQAAEFPTMLPHALGAEGGPCEILGIFDRDARRATSAARTRATAAGPSRDAPGGPRRGSAAPGRGRGARGAGEPLARPAVLAAIVLRTPGSMVPIRHDGSSIAVMTHTSAHTAHDHANGPSPHEPGADDMADFLDLEAAVLAGHLASVAAWLPVPTEPGHVVDLGCGTGAGTFALLTRFPGAAVTAVDASAPHLHRLRERAEADGVAGRVRTVRADLDTDWPGLGRPDLVWASASLHHVADSDRTLSTVHDLLAPGGLFALVEVDSFPVSCPRTPPRTGPAWRSAATPPSRTAVPSTCRTSAPTGAPG